MSGIIPLISTKIPYASTVIYDLISVLGMYSKSNIIHSYLDTNNVTVKGRLHSGQGGIFNYFLFLSNVGFYNLI